MNSNMPDPEAAPNRTSRPIVATVVVAIAVLLSIAGWVIIGTADRHDVVDNDLAATNGACALDAKVTKAITAAATGEVAAFAAMDRPYSVADFRFQDASGTAKSLADWSGRTVLLNLWATWCAPCRAEMPSLDALQRQLGSDDFEVLPISVDRSDASKPKAFFKEISISAMGFFHDAEAMTLNALKSEGLALGLPATLLVDGRGCVIGRLNGPAEWASEDAQNLIKNAL